MTTIRRAVSRTCVGALLLAGAACSDQFLKVTNPNVIDASTVDPTTGAATLAASAQQNFATAFGWLIMYGAWFTDEADVSDTFPTRNEFGFRVISDLNGSLNGDVWQPLSLATASTKIVLDLDLPNPTTNINLARAATFRGFSIEMMAETFCTGTLPRMQRPADPSCRRRRCWTRRSSGSARGSTSARPTARPTERRSPMRRSSDARAPSSRRVTRPVRSPTPLPFRRASSTTSPTPTTSATARGSRIGSGSSRSTVVR